MNLLAINGSPRKGNTEFMLDIVLKSAKEQGANTELINLRQRKIIFCGGGDDCCPVNLKCYIKDDMPEICTKLESADIIILASPCYFSNVAARMKNFMDRCNPYYYNKKLRSKKVFLIGVGGSEESTKDMLKIMKKFVDILDMKYKGSYLAVADKRTDLGNNQKVIKELKNIGNRLK
jgi:multimeric flavodoxin WrbA